MPDSNRSPLATRPPAPTTGFPTVLVRRRRLHPWWGLNDDVIAYADRLADAGLAVIAPGHVRRPGRDDVEDAERLAGGARATRVRSTLVVAAVDGSRSAWEPDAPLAALGFSFGAAYALWAPAKRDRASCARSSTTAR